MGPNLFTCNENSAYVMPCVTTCAVTSCAHCMAHACREASHPYVNMVPPEITYEHAIHASQTIFKKINHFTFCTLNMKIAYQNVLKMILIAMHNKNKAHCNENFRICAEESVGPLYR